MSSALLTPGQVIPLAYGSKKFEAGTGCYEELGKILASTIGTVSIENDTIVSVIRGGCASNSVAQLQIGASVTAKVLRIRENKVDVKILLVEETTVHYNLQGIIRKQDVRTTNLDTLKMDEMFIPGDVIKARFLSFGDSQKLYLTVQDDELGVIFAKHGESKELMIPYSWEDMVCLKSGLKEKRKVAKPNISLFSVQSE